MSWMPTSRTWSPRGTKGLRDKDQLLCPLRQSSWGVVFCSWVGGLTLVWLKWDICAFGGKNTLILWIFLPKFINIYFLKEIRCCTCCETIHFSFGDSWAKDREPGCQAPSSLVSWLLRCGKPSVIHKSERLWGQASSLLEDEQCWNLRGEGKSPPEWCFSYGLWSGGPLGAMCQDEAQSRAAPSQVRDMNVSSGSCQSS